LRSNPTRGVVLFSLAAIPRLLGAFFLPNAFGDAYVYIQEIGTLSTKLANRSFRLTDLFGFWLPFYQFISALLNVFVRNGFYSGKMVAALFGAGACVFVYLITERVTRNTTAALWMFLLIALNPLHIFYSASAMTDVPHAFFVLAALYFVLTGNWIIAAVCGGLAGLIRVESWMLIALIPLVQFIKERRISIIVFVLLVIPPMFWFYISWKATGNWLACFVQRQEYHDWLLRMNPAIAQFSLIQVLKDAATLVVSTDVAVLLACFMAGWFLLEHLRKLMRNGAPEEINALFAPVLFFFAFFTLLVIAYLTHQQPIIFPRYGLILFTLGLPLLAWAFLKIQKTHPWFARRVLTGIAVICVLDISVQLAGAVGTVKQYRVQREVADYLRDHFAANSGTRIFCDDGTVRVLSGIPEEKFVTSANSPGARGEFIQFLKEQRVQYLVLVKPAPTHAISTEGEVNQSAFDLLMHSHTNFIPTDIWLYQPMESEAARP
jgi:Dolichyl-phosphate-mannose-protein mannosyltransferase